MSLRILAWHRQGVVSICYPENSVRRAMRCGKVRLRISVPYHAVSALGWPLFFNFSFVRFKSDLSICFPSNIICSAAFLSRSFFVIKTVVVYSKNSAIKHLSVPKIGIALILNGSVKGFSQK